MEVRYNNSMLAMAKSFEIWYISIAFVEVNILGIFPFWNVLHKLAPLRFDIARQSNEFNPRFRFRFFLDIPRYGPEKRFMNRKPFTL